METKEEKLNIHNYNKPKGRNGSIKKKKGHSDYKKKKEPSKIRIYIFLPYIIFIIIFCFLNYYIYKELKTLSEIKTVLETRKKELDAGDKTRIELLEKIDSVEKQVELKKRYIKEKRELDAQKLEEYNQQKKIYENIEDMQNKIIKENQNSLILDEAINNLNNRIDNLVK